MPKPAQHAPPNSILGLLQRGRGEGYRRVVSLPKGESWPLLVECISNDPRLDSQLESRAAYYAEIALKVELDIGPIGGYLREFDDSDESGWNSSLAVDTLDELAKRGHLGATEMLLDYISWGERWEQLFYDSSAVRSETFNQGAAAALEQRFRTNDELKEALDWFYLDEEPWRSIRRHSPRMANIRMNARKEVELQPKKDFSHLDSLSVSQLLEQEIKVTSGDQRFFRNAMEKIVAPEDVDLLVSHVTLEKPGVASVALARLAKIAPPSIFNWLKKFWSENPNLRGALGIKATEAMVAMPPNLSLPLARDWLRHGRPHENWLAAHVLRVHATREDIPVLRSAIAKGLSDDEENCYRICNLVEAFFNLPDVGFIQELCDVFEQFRYSYGRMLAAHAIIVTSPASFAENYALEALWDCEAETRRLGVEQVPLEYQPARPRLDVLAGDQWEDEEVREAATKRLGNLN